MTAGGKLFPEISRNQRMSKDSLMKTNKIVNNLVPIRTKVGYGLGDFGANLVFQTMTLFLLYYYTDVMMIGASTAGIIFLVAKLWDAVFDPMMGILVDKTHTRWGSKRVYLLFGAIPLGITFFLLFLNPGFTGTGKVVYATITFALFCTLYAVINVPYGSLTASLTRDMHERSKITAFRMSFALLGSLLVAGITKPLIALFSTPSTGFRAIGLVYGFFAAFFTLVAFASTQERVKERNHQKYSFKEELSVIAGNKPFIILSLATLLQFTAINILAAMTNYLFKYNFNHEEFIPIAFLCLFATAIIFMPFWVFVSKKTSKKFTFASGMLIFAISLGLLFSISIFNMPVMIVTLVIGGIGLSTVYLSPWAMIPDTVEYSEWKTGLRREGVLYGFFYFAQKLAVALAGFVCGTGLDFVGYLPNVAQSTGSMQGIRILATIVPMVFILGGIIIISFYPIDANFHRKMIAEIERRK